MPLIESDLSLSYSTRCFSEIESISFTLDEMSFITQRSRVFVSGILNQYFIKHRVSRARKGWVHRFGLAELRLVLISQEIKKDLTPEAYCRVYARLRKLPASSHCLITGVMCFDLIQADQLISRGLNRLSIVKELETELQYGQVFFKNTNISILDIARLSKTKDTKFITDTYPNLAAESVDLASDFVKIYMGANSDEQKQA